MPTRIVTQRGLYRRRLVPRPARPAPQLFGAAVRAASVPRARRPAVPLRRAPAIAARPQPMPIRAPVGAVPPVRRRAGVARPTRPVSVARRHLPPAVAGRALPLPARRTRGTSRVVARPPFRRGVPFRRLAVPLSRRAATQFPRPTVLRAVRRGTPTVAIGRPVLVGRRARPQLRRAAPRGPWRVRRPHPLLRAAGAAAALPRRRFGWTARPTWRTLRRPQVVYFPGTEAVFGQEPLGGSRLFGRVVAGRLERDAAARLEGRSVAADAGPRDVAARLAARRTAQRARS